MSDKFFIGVGKITIDGVETEHPDELQIELAVNEFTRRNSGTVGGGNAAKFSRIENVRLSFNTGNFDKTTLARALKGAATDVAAAAVSENTNGVAGGIAVIDELLDTTQAVTVAHNAGTWAATTAYAVGDWLYDGTHLYQATVAGASGGTSPTFPTDGSTVTDGTVTWQDEGAFAAVEGTDFIKRANGVLCVDGAGIPDGAPITVDGTGYANSRVEVATAASSQHQVAFDGVNEETGEPIVGLWHQVVFDPASVGLVTAEYGAVDMAGEVLSDSSVSAGRSGFGTLRVGDATIL